MPYRHKIWLASLLVLACFTRAHAAIHVGDKFPVLDASAFEGGTPPATAGLVTLVDFWASWCAPCKMSFPVYAQLYSRFSHQGFIILAVSADENQAAYSAFVKKEAPPFATVRDKTHQLVSQVKVPAMPTCYLLGRDGRVRFIHQGFHGAETDRELRQEIESLLAEPPQQP
jgi:thiol-disulfide isomerase/thioredoxin